MCALLQGADLYGDPQILWYGALWKWYVTRLLPAMAWRTRTIPGGLHVQEAKFLACQSLCSVPNLNWHGNVEFWPTTKEYASNPRYYGNRGRRNEIRVVVHQDFLGSYNLGEHAVHFHGHVNPLALARYKSVVLGDAYEGPQDLRYWLIVTVEK